MAMPSRDCGDFLLTPWAESALLFPEMEKPAFSFESVCHVHVETFLKVGFRFRIIGVGLCFDFAVSFYWHVGRLCEIKYSRPSLHKISSSFVGLEYFCDPPVDLGVFVSSTLSLR